MGLYHMLLEPALLDKSLRADPTHMCQLPSVLLHVVEHRVLARFRHATVRTDKLTRGVAQIRHLSYSRGLNSRHGVVAPRHTRPRPGFKFCPASPTLVKPLIDTLLSLTPRIFFDRAIVTQICCMEDDPCPVDLLAHW